MTSKNTYKVFELDGRRGERYILTSGTPPIVRIEKIKTNADNINQKINNFRESIDKSMVLKIRASGFLHAKGCYNDYFIESIDYSSDNKVKILFQNGDEKIIYNPRCLDIKHLNIETYYKEIEDWNTKASLNNENRIEELTKSIKETIESRKKKLDL